MRGRLLACDHGLSIKLRIMPTSPPPSPISAAAIAKQHAHARLAQIQEHVHINMGSTSNEITTAFGADVVPQAPEVCPDQSPAPLSSD